MGNGVNRPAPRLPNRGLKSGQHRPHEETKLIRMAFVGLGLLCLLQAILNISLRLSNQETTAGVVRRLQGRLNATLVDKEQLEAKVTELLTEVKKLLEEKEALRWRMTNVQETDCSGGVCPAGWKSISSRCYFMSTESRDWQGSRMDCLHRRGDLVVINSLEEQEDLCRIYNINHDLLFWIGLYDRESTRRFTWVDGSPLNVETQFWQEGQPDHVGPNNQDDCVEMHHNNRWNAASCGLRLRWLCERDPC